ncbi:MAG: hypothetical protein RXR82_08595 [Nitrososphaeria archaeon]
MRTIRKWIKIEREDRGDAALMTALAAILLSGLEFLFTAMSLHYVTIPILTAEAVAASVAGALIALVAVKATDDEDRSSLSLFLTPSSARPRARRPARRAVILAQVLPARPF